MTIQQAKADALAARLGAGAEGQGGSTQQSWLGAAQAAALARVQGMGLPGKRDEYWRYTDPTSLTTPDTPHAAVFDARDEPPAFDGIDRVRLVFVDGVFDPAQSDDPAAAGVEIDRLAAVADRDSARAYFTGKALFRQFDPECFEAYLEHGLHPEGEQLRLRFDPATEISIYRSVPHLTPGWPPALKIPLAMIRGRDSRVVLPHHGYLLRLMSRGEAHSLPGGHMFPFEQPQQTAEKLRELLGRWGTYTELSKGAA